MKPNNSITYSASIAATASPHRNVVVRVSSGRCTEHESHAADAMDHLRLVRFVHLVPQAAHMDVHQIGLRNELVLPDFLKEHRARQDLVLALHHVFEQPKLARQQFDGPVATLGGALDQIELERTHSQFGPASVPWTPQ